MEDNVVKRTETRIPDELLKKEDLSLTAKIVLAKMIEIWKTRTNPTFGNNSLAESLGLGVKAVIKAKRDLTKLGLISLIKIKKDNWHISRIIVDENKVNEYLGFEYFHGDIYERRKEWLEEKAAEKRDHIKKDCKVLMEYLDKFERVSYIYRPAIMLKEPLKGYIPDIMINMPSGYKMIIDFVDENSKDFSKEALVKKGHDLVQNGYLYRIAYKGDLTGKDAMTPEEFMTMIAESFSN